VLAVATSFEPLAKIAPGRESCRTALGANARSLRYLGRKVYAGTAMGHAVGSGNQTWFCQKGPMASVAQS
jgi:hypothetical protein